MVVILINLTTIQPSQANYATTRAIMASWAGERDIANEIFKRALSYDTFGTYEIRHRFAQYVVDRWSSRTVDQKAKDELFLAIEAVQKNAIAHPLDYLPHLYLARSYIILGKSDPASPYNDLAIASARKALEISPTFVRTYTELAQGYLNKHDYAGTIDAFKRATELNPKVGQTWWYLGITQIESGDKKNGVQSLVKASDAGYQYVNNEDDLLKLAGSFAKSGDFTEVVSLYKILIEFKPDNPQYHASLALAYAKIGEIDKAVAEAKTAAGLDTGFDAEARAFVRSLGREW